ncbi:methylated-DNA--[protein]-cysteine S-methyltransferase [Risungbinella massiliensis]|uniref:methylated-DNA--[protein]-cysteine S-methyltransferase n=1 Tax=Risungbinella massiliensis TaxID=1329796 RepID=UPI000AE2230B|nr:methylated-DNA--[protein]-cysteine S-methyltransferase [Risungbinella massiliensis]
MNKQRIYWSEWKSPWGNMTLGKGKGGLLFLDFAPSTTALVSAEKWLFKHQIAPSWEQNELELQEATKQLQEYMHGARQEFDLELDLLGTPFQRKVWEALRTIPFGETRSYQDIANQIENPKAVRAVGGANNKNPISIIVPCHRVIGANGALVGYGGGLDKKKYLLRLEGIDIQNAI